MCHFFVKDTLPSLIDFSAYAYASTDYPSTRKRQISEGRAMRRKRRAETRTQEKGKTTAQMGRLHERGRRSGEHERRREAAANIKLWKERTSGSTILYLTLTPPQQGMRRKSTLTIEGMSANNTVGIQGVSTEYADALNKCRDAGNRLGLEQVVDYYDKWAQEGTYEKITSIGHYSGAAMAAEFVERYFGDRKDDTYVIDVAAGTGLVGDELKMRGFTKMDALDASDEMLSIAKAKNIYGRIIHDCMDGHRTDIKDDTYDALTTAGGLGKGHIPTRAMTELIRIVKPGGYVCIIMREENLTKIAEYADRLEPFMKQLAEQGAWTQEERNVVPNHIFGRNGVVFVFRVKQSGAPSVTSTQFTK